MAWLTLLATATACLSLLFLPLMPSQKEEVRRLAYCTVEVVGPRAHGEVVQPPHEVVVEPGEAALQRRSENDAVLVDRVGLVRLPPAVVVDNAAPTDVRRVVGHRRAQVCGNNARKQVVGARARPDRQAVHPRSARVRRRVSERQARVVVNLQSRGECLQTK